MIIYSYPQLVKIIIDIYDYFILSSKLDVYTKKELFYKLYFCTYAINVYYNLTLIDGLWVRDI